MGVLNRQYRNQTALHEWLASMSYNFLLKMATQRGIVWRQEHTIHNGMRPDAVGFASLGSRFYRELFADQIKPKYATDDYPDLMFVFEAKTSYTDFKSSFNGDGEWKEQPYGNFHYLIVPKGFTEAYDLSALPDYWGVLEPKRTALHVKKNPRYVEIDRLFLLEAAYTILFKWGITKQRIENKIIF
jgi:hypothetical protein